MNPSFKSVLLASGRVALFAFVVGGGLGLAELLRRPHVLEFQTGAPSSWTEQGWALAQIGAIEGVGFGALALLLGIIALGLARGGIRRDDERRASRFLALWLFLAAAFAGWVSNAWLFEDALPFLTPGELAALNLAGFTTILLGLAVFHFLVGRLPGVGRRDPTVVAVACIAALGIANRSALDAVTGGGSRASALLLAAAIVAVAFPAAALLAALLDPLVRVASRRLRGRRFVPKRLVALVAGMLVACTLGTAPFFSLSALPHDLDYSALEGRGTPGGPNVVFITIDTLRADHLGCYGYERPTSPFLDSLAADGARVRDAVSAAAWTKPATGTILTGLYPSRHGALYHGSLLQLPRGEKTLAEVFRDAGYVTAGFVSNPNIKRVFDFDRGFDEFFDSPVEDTVPLASLRTSRFGRILTDLLRHQFNWKYENDVVQMNGHILAWLERNHAQRFFLYLHYIDPHIPYSPPAAYREMFTREHPGFPLFNERKKRIGVDRYDGEIRYTDDGVAEVVAALRKHGLGEHTLIVVTSDHGEEFFEHEVLGHGLSLFQPEIHVPLILHGPGITAGTVVEGPTAILDLPATVLELAGTGITELGDGFSFASAFSTPAEPDEIYHFLENEFGQSDDDHRAFVFKGVRQGPWKLVITEENAYFPPRDPRYGALALYHLGNDPDETNNLAFEPEHRERVAAMKEKLEAHLRFLDETGFRNSEPAAISEDILGNLRALGY